MLSAKLRSMNIANHVETFDVSEVNGVVDNRGNTPLHRAVESSSMELILKLLSAGARLDICNSLNLDPVQVALGVGDQLVIQVLMRRKMYNAQLEFLQSYSRGLVFQECVVDCQLMHYAPTFSATSGQFGDLSSITIFEDYCNWTSSQRQFRRVNLVEAHVAEENAQLSILLSFQEKKAAALDELKVVRRTLDSLECKFRDQVLAAVNEAKARRRDMEMLTLQITQLKGDLEKAQVRILWEGVVQVKHIVVFAYTENDQIIQLESSSDLFTNRTPLFSVLLPAVEEIRFEPSSKVSKSSFARKKNKFAFSSSSKGSHNSPSTPMGRIAFRLRKETITTDAKSGGRDSSWIGTKSSRLLASTGLFSHSITIRVPDAKTAIESDATDVDHNNASAFDSLVLVLRSLMGDIVSCGRHDEFHPNENNEISYDDSSQFAGNFGSQRIPVEDLSHSSGAGDFDGSHTTVQSIGTSICTGDHSSAFLQSYPDLRSDLSKSMTSASYTTTSLSNQGASNSFPSSGADDNFAKLEAFQPLCECETTSATSLDVKSFLPDDSMQGDGIANEVQSPAQLLQELCGNLNRTVTPDVDRKIYACGVDSLRQNRSLIANIECVLESTRNERDVVTIRLEEAIVEREKALECIRFLQTLQGLADLPPQFPGNLPIARSLPNFDEIIFLISIFRKSLDDGARIGAEYQAENRASPGSATPCKTPVRPVTNGNQWVAVQRAGSFKGSHHGDSPFFNGNGSIDSSSGVSQQWILMQRSNSFKSAGRQEGFVGENSGQIPAFTRSQSLSVNSARKSVPGNDWSSVYSNDDSISVCSESATEIKIQEAYELITNIAKLRNVDAAVGSVSDSDNGDLVESSHGDVVCVGEDTIDSNDECSSMWRTVSDRSKQRSLLHTPPRDLLEPYECVVRQLDIIWGCDFRSLYYVERLAKSLLHRMQLQEQFSDVRKSLSSGGPILKKLHPQKLYDVEI